jgi:hypothetical protein
MGIRFRRRVTIAPGVRLNVSKSGVSLSAGPRGASVTVGKRGVYRNVGIPGTGLYSRQRMDRPALPAAGRSASVSGIHEISVRLNDDGSVDFIDPTTELPLEPRIERIAKQQQGDHIRAWLENQCAAINAEIEALSAIHVGTPDPRRRPRFVPVAFDEHPPNEPTAKRMPLLLRPFRALLRGLEARIAEENQERERRYEEQLADWQRRKDEFDEDQRAEKWLIEEEI